MAVTCLQVFERAQDRSTANLIGLFSGKERELLTRINYGQQRLFTRLANENRYFYVQPATLNSTNAASGRTADLATLAPPAERLILAKLPNGVELSQVDLQDIEAELAPRFYPLGAKMVEVGTDWGVAGVVALSLWYAYRPAELNLDGDLSQTVTVPDRFCEWLELDMALYLAGKDFGRAVADPQEIARLTADQDRVTQDFLTHLDHLPGPSSRRFVLPVPPSGEKA